MHLNCFTLINSMSDATEWHTTQHPSRSTRSEMKQNWNEMFNCKMVQFSFQHSILYIVIMRNEHWDKMRVKQNERGRLWLYVCVLSSRQVSTVQLQLQYSELNVSRPKIRMKNSFSVFFLINYWFILIYTIKSISVHSLHIPQWMFILFICI